MMGTCWKKCWKHDGKILEKYGTRMERHMDKYGNIWKNIGHHIEKYSRGNMNEPANMVLVHIDCHKEIHKNDDVSEEEDNG